MHIYTNSMRSALLRLAVAPDCGTPRVATPRTSPPWGTQTSTPGRFNLCQNAKLKVKSATNINRGVIMCSKYNPSIECENICYSRLKHSNI